METYRTVLAGVPGITLNPEVEGTRNVYWMVSVVLGDEVRLSRDEVCARLKARGIDSRPFFAPMSALPHLARSRRIGASSEGCPVSARLSARGFNLPSGCGLSVEDVARAADALIGILAS
jgi:perosamine synthetase